MNASLNDIYKSLGGLEEAVKTLNESGKAASESRGKMYAKLDEISSEQKRQGTAIETLQTEVEEMKPGWVDYQKKAQQVKGAGKLGRALWLIGGAVLTGAASIVSAMTWLGGKE